MQTSTLNLSTIAAAGSQALKNRDYSAAREHFLQLVAANPKDAHAWLSLGQAASGLGEVTAAIAAFDRVLALQPQNIRALIFKADLLAGQGKDRLATAHYQQALRLSTQRSDTRELRDDLLRAQAMCERYAAQYEEYLRTSLERTGYQPGAATHRFGQALDIMFGKKKIYLQQPRTFYFPGLPTIEFYPRSQFPWLDEVEAATEDIRGELLTVLRDGSAFTPYVEGSPDLPRKSNLGMTDNPNWGAFYLMKSGRIVDENVARCPKAFAALRNVPMPDASQRCPSALFSLLRPHTRIPPHNGLINTRLICHLPLIIPEGCGFRVGNETRAWVEGKAWAFDDTIDHEAWNDSDKLRVILIFETWRPELSLEERALITAMFRAIDDYTGETPKWEI